MTFDFDLRIQRRGTSCSKWDKFEEDILPMWVADMDFRPPPVVVDALKGCVEHGVFGYPFMEEDVKQVVVDWMAKRHHWQIDPQSVVNVPGVVTGFNLAAHAVTEPGDGVMVQTPAYGPFLKVAKNVRLEQHEMELTRGEDGVYSVDYELFEETIKDNTRIFMLCNPQNPTGRVFRQDELEKMAEICLRHGVIICADEIHSDLVYPGHQHTSIASLNEEIAQNSITLMAASKSFNIAGLKASAAIIPNPELRERYENARQGLVDWVSGIGNTAMIAAFQGGEEWLAELMDYLEANRDYLAQFVQERLPGVELHKPEGTFLAWLDCRSAGIDGKPSDFFREKARVEMNDGEWFGQGGKGFVRLNFGCPRSMLTEALERMEQALAAVKDH